jgi:hypothetical protein
MGKPLMSLAMSCQLLLGGSDTFATGLHPLVGVALVITMSLYRVAGTRVVFRDSGFADDIAKTNMAAILNQNGISDVRSL